MDDISMRAGLQIGPGFRRGQRRGGRRRTALAGAQPGRQRQVRGGQAGVAQELASGHGHITPR